MLYVSTDQNGSVINLTAGDDAAITIAMEDDRGEPRDMDPNEYLIFSVREKPMASSALLLELESERGSNEIKFQHEDTSEMTPGYYSAEIQLMTEDGQRITVWPKLSGNSKISQANRKNFCLMTEVVYR